MKEKLENKIMKDIKNGKVKLKSKYLFLAERLGLGSGIVLTILLAALVFNLILFYMQETDNLIYLTFGPNGFLPFLESFPYLLVVIFIIIIFLVGFLIKKTDFVYKKSFGEWSIYLILFIMAIGTFLTFTNINNEIQKNHEEFMRPFFEHRPSMKNGIAGIIIEKSNNGIVLNTREGIKNINIQNTSNLNINDFIIIVGENKGDTFLVKEIKKVDNPMLLIRDKLEPPQKP